MKLHSIDIDSSKMARKLRAIASHAEQLAKELEAIENEWQCDCGSFKYEDTLCFVGEQQDVQHLSSRRCKECGEQYAIPSEPTVSDA